MRVGQQVAGSKRVLLVLEPILMAARRRQEQPILEAADVVRDAADVAENRQAMPVPLGGWR